MSPTKALGAVLLLVACGSGTLTHAPFQYAAELSVAMSEAAPTIVQRWPDCALDGWTMVGVSEPFIPPRGALCGATPCTGRVRGHTDPHARQIRVWTHDPHLVQVIAWEGCNACRWEQTRVLRDGGCA